MKLTVPSSAQRAMPAISQAVIAAIVVTALDLGRQVLIPIALAGLLSFILTPLLTRLRKLGLGKVPSVIALTLFSFTLLAAIAVMVGNQITQLASNLPQYEYGLQEKINSVRDKATNGVLLRGVTKVVQGLGHEITKPPQTVASAPVSPSTAPESQPEHPPLPVAQCAAGP